jgi:PilZ domain
MNLNPIALTGAPKRLTRIKLEDCPPPRLVMRETKKVAGTSNPICPDCSKEFVKRVNCQGIAERVLSLFYVYPFRCQLCGQRFSYRQWGVRYVSVKEDRREYDRLATSFPVSISAESLDAEGKIIDISMSGCTLKSDADLSPGTVLGLALHISNEVVPVIVEAAVVRNARMHIAGLEFLKFHDDDREVLQLFIRGLLLDRGQNLPMEDYRQ